MGVVKPAEVKPGMVVGRDILGKKGRVLVKAGEKLTKVHCEKLQKWEKRKESVSQFNPRGIEIQKIGLGDPEAPVVEKDPSLSPLMKGYKSKFVGGVSFDKQGAILRDEEKTTPKKRGRPAKTIKTV